MGKSTGLGQAYSKTTMIYSVNFQWFGGQGLPDPEMVCLCLKAEKGLNLYSKHLNATRKKHLSHLVREIEVQYKYKAVEADQKYISKPMTLSPRTHSAFWGQ